MTQDELEDALIVVAGALARAITIAGAPPYLNYSVESDNAKLFLSDGADVELWWWEAETDYDYCRLETHKCVFPAALLFLSDEAFADYLIEQKEIVRAKSRATEKARKEAAERAERQQFESLKRKFEGGQ